MKGRSTIAGASAVALGLATAALGATRAYLDGPPTGHTGGFGEPTCAECHFDNAVNDGVGEVRIHGLPEEYEAGRDYEITLEVRRPGMARGGFQAAARFVDGEAKGRQAGAVESADDRSVVQRADSVAYIQHTVAGSDAAEGVARWTFTWTAPARPSGRVVFHAAGNAANDDDSEFGDYIYLVDAVSRLRQ